MKSRLFSVFVAFLVLTSTFAAPVNATSTTAMASGDGCSDLEEFVWALAWGAVLDGGPFDDQCDSTKLTQEINDLEDQSENATKAQLYDSAAAQDTQTGAFLSTSENYLNDSRTVAWGKAEAAAVEAMKNGTGRSGAKAAAHGAVDEYYTHRQVNIITSYNTSLLAFDSLRDEAISAGIQPKNARDGYVQFDEGTNVSEPDHFVNTSFQETTISLLDGSTRTITYVEAEAVFENGDMYSRGNFTAVNLTMGYRDESDAYVPPSYSNEKYWIEGALVKAPDAGYENLTYVDFNRHSELWLNTLSQRNQINDNIDAYVDYLYDQQAAGNLNASTYVSPTTLAQEYSTDLNSTGYYSYAVAMASLSGYGTADLNTTGHMEITYESTSGSNVTVTGFLMSQNAPNGTWKVGTTYDASNISGNQFIITDNAGKIDVEGKFWISAIEDKNGNALDSTTTHNYYYQQSNSTEYALLVEELKTLRDEIYDREPKSGGGSGSGWSWDWLPDLNDPWLLAGAAGASLAVVAALGVVLKMSRPY